MTPRSWPSPARSSTACMSTTGGPCCSAANLPDQETPMRRPSLRRHQAPGPAPEPASVERDEDRPEPQGLGAVLRYFLRLGTLGFGGPIAVVGYMQRDLVEQRGWISKQDFLDGVALGQTMPGPLAAQVAMWVGYLKRGAVGAAATALAFIAPSFLLVIAIGFLYVRYQGLPVVQSLFYGISPAVIAIIALAAWELGPLTDGRDRRLWVVSAVVGIVTAATGTEVALLFIAAGLLLLLWDAPPSWLPWRRAASLLSLPLLSMPTLGAAASAATLLALFLFFLK